MSTERAYLNNAGQITVTYSTLGSNDPVVRYDPAGNVVTTPPDGSTQFHIAPNSVNFLYYASGALKTMETIHQDGSHLLMNFADVTGVNAVKSTFGTNGDLVHGALLYYDYTTAKSLPAGYTPYEIKETFDGGHLVKYELNTADGHAGLTGTYVLGSGLSTLALTVPTASQPLVTSGTGQIDGLTALSVAQIISHDGGGLVAAGGGNFSLIGQDGGGLVAAGGGNWSVKAIDGNAYSLISQDGGGLNQLNIAGLIGQDGAGIVSHDGGGIVSHDGGGIVSHDGGGLVAAGGGNLIAVGGGNLVAAGGGNVVPVTALQSLSTDAVSLISNDGAGLISNAASVISNDGAGVVSNDGAGLANRYSLASLDSGSGTAASTGTATASDGSGIANQAGNAFADYVAHFAAGVNSYRQIPAASAAGAPDLTVKTAYLDVGSADAGGKVNVSWLVKNVGSGAAPASTSTVYLSTDANVGAHGTVLGTLADPSLGAGDSVADTLSVTLPGTLTPGQYYIGVVANGTGQVGEDGTNNASPPLAIHVPSAGTPLKPDLTVAAAYLDEYAAEPGDVVNVSWAVHNAGTADAGTSTSKLYLSTDNIITSADLLVGSLPDPVIRAGNLLADTLDVTLPKTLAGGTYYLGVIADANGSVAESNEANNLSVPLPVKVSVPLPAAQASKTQFKVGTDTHDHTGPKVAGLSNGGYVVTWTDTDQATQPTDAPQIHGHGQVYAADGSPVGAQFSIQTSTDKVSNDATVSGLTDGHFVATWSESVYDTSKYQQSEVHAQIFNADGTRLGPEIVVDGGASRPAQQFSVGGTDPVVTKLDGGGFVVAYQYGEKNGNSLGTLDDQTNNLIEARLYDASGAALGAPLVVAASAHGTGFLSTPAVTALKGGGFAVTEVGPVQGSNGVSTDILAQFFDASGNSIGSGTIVDAQQGNMPSAPSIATLANGNLAVVWHASAASGATAGPGVDASQDGVYAQILTPTGSKVGGQFLVNTTTFSDQLTAKVAALGDGRFVVTWTDFSSAAQDGSISDVRAQIFNPDGSKSGTEFIVNSELSGPQVRPGIASLTGGGFVTAWEDGFSGYPAQRTIQAQAFSFPTPGQSTGGTGTGAAIGIDAAVRTVVDATQANAGLTVSGTATGAADGTSVGLTVSDSGGAVLSARTGAVSGGTWTFTLPGALLNAAADGTYTLRADILDATGHNLSETTRSFVLDKNAPVLTLQVPSQSQPATSSAGAAVSFTGSAMDAIDGSDPIVFQEGQHIVHSGDVFGLGDHTILASATDRAGNVVSTGFTFTVTAPATSGGGGGGGNAGDAGGGSGGTGTAPPPVSAAGGTASPAAGQTQTVDAITSGSLTVDGAGKLVLTGTSTYTEPTEVKSGTLSVNGSIVSPVTVESGATLGGSGSTGTVTIETGGTLSPGNSPGVLTTKDLSLAAGAMLKEELGGVSQGQFDQTKVVGTVALAGANLSLASYNGFVSAYGDHFAVIDNDGTDAVQGRFAGLSEGASLTLGSHSYLISYHGGDGNDVVLTDVTLPDGVTLVPFGSVAHDPSGPTGAVYGLYEAILGRSPDALGLENFAGSLANGAASRDVAGAILASPEYAALHAGGLADAAFVGALYASLLDRAPDAGGQAFFLGELGAGVDRATVATQVATSLEARADLAPAFQIGVFTADAIDSAVARLYAGVLGRAPDAGGLAAFEAQVHQAVASGGTGGAVQALASVSQVMLSSQEFSNTHGNLSDAAFVDSLYVGALGHHADDTAQGVWGGQLAHGVSRVQVAVQIAESGEAQAHLAGVIEQGWHLSA